MEEEAENINIKILQLMGLNHHGNTMAIRFFTCLLVKFNKENQKILKPKIMFNKWKGFSHIGINSIKEFKLDFGY